MNTPTLLASAIVVSAATAAAFTWFAARPAAPPDPAVAEGALAARIAGVEARLGELAERLERASADVERAAPRSPVQPVAAEEIEAAVRRVLAAGAVRADGEAGPAAAAMTREQALAQLAATGGRFDRIEEVWPKIAAAGMEDAVIAHYKALADAAPTDAQAHFMYGACLIAGIEDKPMAKQGQLAIAADAAFDKVLTLDEKHWPARFMKATSLSFWPKITGKHVEAMRHFEILADQQEQGPPQNHYAETYLFLGNLHLDNGDRDKARAAFERGLRWFPEHAELRKQAAAAKK